MAAARLIPGELPAVIKPRRRWLEAGAAVKDKGRTAASLALALDCLLLLYITYQEIHRDMWEARPSLGCCALLRIGKGAQSVTIPGQAQLSSINVRVQQSQ